MSVTINGSTLVPNADREYKGLSTDTKPTNCEVNSLFLELDTGDIYYFVGSEYWVKVGDPYLLNVYIGVYDSSTHSSAEFPVEYLVAKNINDEDPIASGAISGDSVTVSDVPLGSTVFLAKSGEGFEVVGVESFDGVIEADTYYQCAVGFGRTISVYVSAVD